MSAIKCRNRSDTQITPIKLNRKWPIAARRAFLLAPIAARLAVMVVPKFSPNTKAHAVGKLIIPAAAHVSVRAITALEDCKTTVSTVPVAMSAIKCSTVSGLNLVNHWVTHGLDAKSAGMVFFIKSNPKNNSPKPTAASPIRRSATHLVGKNWLKKPSAITGKANKEIWILNPNKLTTQAVSVVPILAPKITPSA